MDDALAVRVVERLGHLLEHVQRRAPHAVRIGFSGYGDAAHALETANVAHQFFPKPLSLPKLRACIERIEAVQTLLDNDDLRRQIAAVEALPTLPTLYIEIMEEAASQYGSLDRVGRIIERDVAMTAKILNIVNAPFFGLPAQATSAEQAASLLGFDGLRTMVLSVGVFTAYEAKGAADDLAELMQHSVRISRLTGSLARQFGLSEQDISTCELAGMLHDIGKLVVHHDIPHAARTLRTMTSTGIVSNLQAERDLLGCTHMEIGAYLLSLWGFDYAVVEAVGFHHEPASRLAEDTGPLALVHLADALDRARVRGLAPAETVDPAVLARLGIQPGEAAAALAAFSS